MTSDISLVEHKMSQTPGEFQLSQGVASESSIPLAKQMLRESYEKLVLVHERYLDWSIEEIKLQAVWDIATYFSKQFSTFPYRFITAMKSSGKSRLLKMTQAIAWNAMVTAGMTDSALFRSADKGTLIFDEAESITSKDKKSQRLILNSGYKRGASIQVSAEKRVDGKKEYVLESYPVYGPKMLANIWGMEEVLGSRCIGSIMEKSNNPAKVRLMEDFDTNPFFKQLKEDISRANVVLCMYIYDKNVQELWNSYINAKYPTSCSYHTYNNINIHITTLKEEELDLFNKVDEYGIDGRNLELFFPLFMVAHLLGEDVLCDILKIAGSKVKDKKESDLIESKDISVIDFVSNQSIDKSISYTRVMDLTNEFKRFFENDEDNSAWLNPHWFGNALARLNLVTAKKRVSKGMEVILDINKAKEKLKIFK